MCYCMVFRLDLCFECWWVVWVGLGLAGWVRLRCVGCFAGFVLVVVVLLAMLLFAACWFTRGGCVLLEGWVVVALDWMFWVGGNCIVIVVAVDCLVLDGCFGLLGSLDVVWFGLITFVCFWIAASSFCWIGSMSWISLCFVCIGNYVFCLL